MRLGSRVLCTVVIDYVPSRLRGVIDALQDDLAGKGDGSAFAQCDILPGDGFVWDDKAKTLRAQIPAGELPTVSFEEVAIMQAMGNEELRQMAPDLAKKVLKK